MPLITCPDCGKQVSDQAPACPSCGRPNANIQNHSTQTVEATGKKWKIAQLIGFVMIIIGVVSGIASISLDSQDATFTPVFLCLGFLIFIGGRIGAWWYHK